MKDFFRNSFIEKWTKPWMGERRRRILGLLLMVMGLVAIYFYVSSKSPHRCEVKITFLPEGISASYISIEYTPVGDSSSTPYRRVEKFPKKKVAYILDRPSLPEGEYIILMRIISDGKLLTYSRNYTHMKGGLTVIDLGM